MAASAGAAPAPQLVLRALAAGAVPVASRLPQYEEALDEGELGLLFEPRDAVTLAGQLDAAGVATAAARRAWRERVDSARPAARLEHAAAERSRTLYGRLAARRHPTRRQRQPCGKRLAEREFIHVDLHMHTDHSHDCATPVDTLLEAAKAAGPRGDRCDRPQRGLGRARGAREGRAGRRIKVIVAEEVKTADQGEVIGLFIEEQDPARA